MRLLNVNSLEFEVFIGEVGDGIPVYAILSHTWGAEEVSYSEYINKTHLSKSGYDKIYECCKLAKSEGFDYVWVDTCCIDKSSSAELSEAINSMFAWYKNAGICYAYLSDVKSLEDPTCEDSSFTRSRWFTRGWTLQELLAPMEVVFLGLDWIEIGTKKSLRRTVSRTTRISERVLEECRWDEYSVAQKMSWAADRRSTRLEDEAYCLMGLFDVNMPLLYGEGRKAFSRLQQEILKQSDDHSIFAWSHTEEGHTQISGLMAPSPAYFKDSSEISLLDNDNRSGTNVLRHERGENGESPFQVVNQLVKVSLFLLENVKGVKLQQLLEKPSLHNVLETHRDGEVDGQGQSRPGSGHSSNHEDSSIYQEPGELSMPMITINEPDTSNQTPFESSELGSQQAFKATEWPLPYRPEPTEKYGAEENLKFLDHTIPHSWRSYIYAPAIIVPLRCHIGGHRIGILLSGGAIATEGGALSRLHNPSIVAINNVKEFRKASLSTIYVNLSTRMNKVPNSLQDWDRPMWPEIRISTLLSGGFTIHPDCGPGWKLDIERGAVVQTKTDFQHEFELGTYAPILLFYRRARENKHTCAFFLSMPTYKKSDLTCEIGAFITGAAPLGRIASGASDYNLYSFHLAREWRAEVPLGNGEAMVAKYREGVKTSFVSLSIEIPSRSMETHLVPHDKAKTDWLSSKIFPRIRSLR